MSSISESKGSPQHLSFSKQDPIQNQRIQILGTHHETKIVRTKGDHQPLPAQPLPAKEEVKSNVVLANAKVSNAATASIAKSSSSFAARIQRAKSLLHDLE